VLGYNRSMHHPRTVTLAFTGASGMPYGLRLLVVARVLDQLGVEHTLGPRWGTQQDAPVAMLRT
jgi:3-polyprenyl-4-hydroxybenzoate decarboxylase